MTTTTPPYSRSQVIELYFLEHRAKLIDVAAFLDRLDRASDDLPADDFRITAFREALAILSDGESHRARRVLKLLSDPTEEPTPAATTQGAVGAAPPPPPAPAPPQDAGAAR